MRKKIHHYNIDYEILSDIILYYEYEYYYELLLQNIIA